MWVPAVPPEGLERLVRALDAATLPAVESSRPLLLAAEQILHRRLVAGPRPKLLRELEALATQLDRDYPTWHDAAVALVLSPHAGCHWGDWLWELGEWRRLAALLATHPVPAPTSLCQALTEPADARQRQFAAMALLGTDGDEVCRATRRAFDQLVGFRSPQDRQTLWLLFARLAADGATSYSDLRLAALGSDLLEPHDLPVGFLWPCDKGERTGWSLHPSLDRSGLSSLPGLRAQYAALVAELVPSASTTPAPWTAVRWIRCFPGPERLLDALDCLSETPRDALGLLALRWAQVSDEDAEVATMLSRYPGTIVMLTSLLRPDLAAAAGEVLAEPCHASVVQWLLRPGREAAEDEEFVEGVVRPWVAGQGGLLLSAVSTLCSVHVPEDEPWPAGLKDAADPTKLQRFVQVHLLPGLANLLDNLLLVQGMMGVASADLEASAAEGRPAAIRALGLLPDTSEELARLLLRLRDSGGEPARRAARWALERMARQHGLSSVDALRAKLDMAAAWEDGGLAGAPARVWWDIAGHRVKLSVANGKVEVSAWGPGRRKTIPAKVREHPLYHEVRAARLALAHTYSIFRARLEEAMVTETTFTAAEFRALLSNPAFRSLAERLVLCIGDDYVLLQTMTEAAIGELLKEGAAVSVVHPIGLWHAGKLSDWQAAIARACITQPFKQCFREIYPPDEGERKLLECARFAGQPIRARTAYALLRGRGYSPCQGDAYKDWEREGVRARFVWAEEVEDLWRQICGVGECGPVMTGAVRFEPIPERRGQKLPSLVLGEVSAIVFSETLRDADLVVSTAAAGEEGFSSRQTIEIRAALVRNLARLLGMSEVAVDAEAAQVLINGQRARYRIHLGSGRVLIEPTGRHLALPHIGVEAPLFASDERSDSRTLAIVDAVAVLAHDDEIVDPGFLAAVSDA